MKAQILIGPQHRFCGKSTLLSLLLIGLLIIMLTLVKKGS
jgi:hypothetical protein